MLQNEIVLCEAGTTFYVMITGHHEGPSSIRKHCVGIVVNENI